MSDVYSTVDHVLIYEHRPRHRRDSGAIKDLRGELQDALDEIGMHIDAMLDDWLIVGENGT